MTEFTLHTQESAPEAAKPLLENSIKSFGMIPNLHAVMAEAPPFLEGYQTLHNLAQQTSFDAEELTVVWQTINVEHACHYCVPAHTGIAHSMKVNSEITDALRNETPLPTKLEALRTVTLAIVRERGVVGDDVLNAFFAAGYEQKNVLEVLLILSQKVMSNYVNHIAKTPVDAPFKAFVWEKK
ncbi:MAG: carboxymuconolactone decarboxylase family protein [Bermanella sp.]